MRRFAKAAGSVGVLSSALLCYGFFSEPAQASYSYLFAYIAVTSLVVGALFFLMIGHATNAVWFVPLRRQCEGIVGALPLLALLVVPLLLFSSDLYPWTHWQQLPPLEKEHVAKKLLWLNVPFFAARSLLYVALLVLVGELLCRWSRLQDQAAQSSVAAKLRERMVNLSVGGLVLLSFVLTFAAWDWVMTLEPAWYSNLYGVYLFAGGLLAALGLTGIRVVVETRRGELLKGVGSAHLHALGRLQLTMVIFWAYIGWCHVLEQWIANLPLEALWHLKRWYHGWQWQGLALVAVHFVIPFLWLLSRSLKRRPLAFAGMSTWLVAAHAVDVHYLIAPALHPKALTWHWLDVIAVLAIAGLSIGFAAARQRGKAALPTRDPLLSRGLAYESPP